MTYASSNILGDAIEKEAVDLLDAGDLAAAERMLQEMLKQDPNSLPAHFHLTRVYRRAEQYHRALIHGRRTLKLNPKEPNASLNLALVYDEIGNARTALSYYKRELRRDPYSGETLWNLGRLYFEKHRWLSASKCLQRCLDIGFWDDVENTLDKLGYSYWKLNNVGAYIRAYENYLNVVSSSAWASANLGRALLHAKHYKRAVLWLMKAYRLDPKGAIAEELFQARQALASSRKGNHKKRVSSC